MRCFSTGILILAGNKTLFIVDHNEGGKEVYEPGVAFENNTGFAQFCLGVLGSNFYAQFLNLFVCYAGHTPTGDQRLTVTVFCINEAQYAMANATNNRFVAGVLCFTDLLGQYG